MASERALVGNVWVDGELYVAGDVPPADVAARITNPKLWPAEEDSDKGSSAPAAKPRRSRKAADETD